jgi:polyvinyl alcohol dehydrogenase (cytochrome)
MNSRQRGHRGGGWLLGIVVGISLVALVSPSASGAGPVDWPTYLYGRGHSSFNDRAVVITPQDASTLMPAWSSPWLPDDFPDPTTTDPPRNILTSSPTEYRGRIYIGANTGVFYALDEGTGAVVWKRFAKQPLYRAATTNCQARGFSSTAAVAIDPSRGTAAVYVAAGDGYLYALDAATGVTLWRSLVTRDGYDWSSPVITNGHIYVGISAEECDHLIRAGLREYDQATAALLHTYRTVPAGSTGGSIWTSPATDGQFVWVTTGNAGTGANGDSFSLVRLNAATLTRLDKWRVPNTAGTDLDWGSSPTLFTATINGVSTDMVGACNKNGVYYAFNRSALSQGPVWRRRIDIRGDLTGGTLCLAAAVWDRTGNQLIVGSSETMINGTLYPGSVRALDPATGHLLWGPVPVAEGRIIGSPSMDGGGVVAASTFTFAANDPSATYLIEASDGAVLDRISFTGGAFPQPVYADRFLLVATKNQGLFAYAPPA